MQGCKCKFTADATDCEQSLRLDFELTAAIRRAGISLGLARQYRCAYGAHPSGVGTPTPRSIALVLQKPSIIFIASRCVRSLRLCIGFRFASVQQVSLIRRSVRVRASAFGAS